MKRLLLLSLLIFALTSVEAKNYKNKIRKYYYKNNREKIFICLEEWQKKKPDDADMYLALANYYLEESQISIPDKDPETIKMKKEYNIKGSSYVYINNSIFNLAQETILEGIRKNPDRFDLYNWRISSLIDRGTFMNHTEDLYNFLETNKNRTSKWRTTDYSVIDKSDIAFASLIDRLLGSINRNSKYESIIVSVANKIKDYFPDMIRCYAILSCEYCINNDWNNAIKYSTQCIDLIENQDIIKKSYNLTMEYIKGYQLQIKAESLLALKDYKSSYKYYKISLNEYLDEKTKAITKVRIKYLKDKLKELKDKDAA